MTPEMSSLVHPVISHALAVRERLESGSMPAPELETEQRTLLNLLRSQVEARREYDYGGDEGVFLGARYALTCWIDELFILHSSWGPDWNNRKLEFALYGTNNRAFQFWDQVDVVLRRPNAPLVPRQPGLDAVETFFLCIMLGFRGMHLDDPAKVQDYVKEMRAQVTRPGTWDEPGDLGVKTNVEPLGGRDRLRKVVSVYSGVAVVVALVLLIVLRLVST